MRARLETQLACQTQAGAGKRMLMDRKYRASELGNRTTSVRSHQWMRLRLKAMLGARRGKLERILMRWSVLGMGQCVRRLQLLRVALRLKVWRGMNHRLRKAG